MTSLKTWAFSSIVAICSALAATQPFSPEDLWNWRRASGPQINAAGSHILYIEERNDRARNSTYANLWLVSTDGKESRRLTDGAWRDGSPRWSPDGARLAWISDRGGKSQIRMLTLAGGQETVLADVQQAPLEIAWSPDGNSIAFSALIPPKLDGISWAPSSILSRLRNPEGRRHIFVTRTAGGTAQQISTGDSDFHEPAWMPDGSTVVASDGKLWAFRVFGGTPRQLTREPRIDAHPLPSPDGSRIAWLSMSANPQSYAIRKLMVMNADGSRARVLGGTLDRDATEPAWSSDSRTVYFLADDRGSTHVYAARNDGAARQATTGQERLRGFSLADNGRAVSIRSTPAEAGSVVTFLVDRPSQPVKLAGENEELLAARALGLVEEIHYPSDGKTIQAWLVKPAGFDAAKKYPLLVDAADGPRRMYGVEFQVRAQMFAARGWVVLCANPRGTPGYGEQFGNLIKTRYPGDDFDDLMRGVDFVAAKGYVDAKRMAIAGGLLAAWAIGHTDRFERAVVRRPVADWVANVATAPDGARRARNWMGAMPWEDPDQYIKHSPIFFAANFRTPTLVIAGDRDVEAEELYWALKQRGVEAALMQGGDRPGDRVAELEASLAWLK
jgi:acylaminoacyl-peptidase